jgi:hypothetical protein
MPPPLREYICGQSFVTGDRVIRSRPRGLLVLHALRVLQPSTSDLYLMLGYNVSVPPHVRQAMFSRAFDNDGSAAGRFASLRSSRTAPRMSGLHAAVEHEKH